VRFATPPDSSSSLRLLRLVAIWLTLASTHGGRGTGQWLQGGRRLVARRVGALGIIAPAASPKSYKKTCSPWPAGPSAAGSTGGQAPQHHVLPVAWMPPQPASPANLKACCGRLAPSPAPATPPPPLPPCAAQVWEARCGQDPWEAMLLRCARSAAAAALLCCPAGGGRAGAGAVAGGCMHVPGHISALAGRMGPPRSAPRTLRSGGGCGAGPVLRIRLPLMLPRGDTLQPAGAASARWPAGLAGQPAAHVYLALGEAGKSLLWPGCRYSRRR
jgi:hypothetical protein